MIPTTHQNCQGSPPGMCGSFTFMPYIPVSTVILTMFQKRIQGVLYGSLAPSKDILRLLGKR